MNTAEASKGTFSLLDILAERHSLSVQEYRTVIEGFSAETMEYAESLADSLRRCYYDNTVFIRGLIEISSYCHNDCFYCGLRRSNSRCQRYTLTEREILECCDEGYRLGFRTFVLQGGEHADEDALRICHTVRKIKSGWPDCAVTLSLGEYPRSIYQALFDAGADRYLLRHETADREHYKKLHPPRMSFDNRMRCLCDLQEIGFQAGCGFMVGSPFQTPGTLAEDLKFIEDYRPAMCGIGPFIPQRDTPFGRMPAGSRDMTLYLLSILRIMHPGMLIPSTTALSTVDSDAHCKGIRAGANVIMPNLSPEGVRKKYALYDGKACSGSEAAEGLSKLKSDMEKTGYRIVVSRGDPAVLNNNV